MFNKYNSIKRNEIIIYIRKMFSKILIYRIINKISKRNIFKIIKL